MDLEIEEEKLLKDFNGDYAIIDNLINELENLVSIKNIERKKDKLAVISLCKKMVNNILVFRGLTCKYKASDDLEGALATILIKVSIFDDLDISLLTSFKDLDDYFNNKIKGMNKKQIKNVKDSVSLVIDNFEKYPKKHIQNFTDVLESIYFEAFYGKAKLDEFIDDEIYDVLDNEIIDYMRFLNILEKLLICKCNFLKIYYKLDSLVRK